MVSQTSLEGFLTDLRQQLLQHLRDGGVVGSRAFWDGAHALLLSEQQVAEEAGDVSGAQSVVKDGAADGLLQDAEQDELLVDLCRRGDEGAELLLVVTVVVVQLWWCWQ